MVSESSRASHEQPDLFLPPRDLCDLTQVPTEAPEVNQLLQSRTTDVSNRRNPDDSAWITTSNPEVIDSSVGFVLGNALLVIHLARFRVLAF
jgi:hypothetical protein